MNTCSWATKFLGNLSYPSELGVIWLTTLSILACTGALLHQVEILYTSQARQAVKAQVSYMNKCSKCFWVPISAILPSLSLPASWPHGGVPNGQWTKEEKTRACFIEVSAWYVGITCKRAAIVISWRIVVKGNFLIGQNFKHLFHLVTCFSQ